MSSSEANKETKEGIPRRKFLTGLGAGLVVGAVAGAAIGSLGFPQTITKTSTSTQTSISTSISKPWLPAKWDYTADVVVVGFGGAGGAAAYEASTAGVSTIVLERMTAGGGSTNINGGVIYMGGGTPLQTALGFNNDTPTNMYNYVFSAGGFGADPDITQTYCNNSLDLYNWLTNTIGVKFNQSYQDRYPAPNNATYGLYMSGDEWHWASVATAVPRGHTTMGIPNNTTHSGSGVFQPLQAAVVKAGAQILYQTLGKKLVVDEETGRVLGVVASSSSSSSSSSTSSSSQQSGDIYIEAKRAVILTAGGFAFNKDMLTTYAPAYAGVSPLGTPGDDGTGIKMGQEIGADVRNMSEVFAAGPVGSGYSPDSPIAMYVLINQQGLRYMAEDHYLSWSGMAIIQQYTPSYLIMDSNIYQLNSSPPGATQADTIHDLAVTLKTPTGVLEDTINLYNQSAANGEDPLFNKYTGYVVPLVKPPFYALPAAGSAAFTHGGLRVNTNAQVLDTTGTAIPGLYAAGRTSATVLAQNYQGSGTSVASALIFGRIAGKNAAAEQPWA